MNDWQVLLERESSPKIVLMEVNHPKRKTVILTDILDTIQNRKRAIRKRQRKKKRDPNIILARRSGA
jgi:hypothetical protein